MSMDFTEFRRRLGAEPRSADPELLRARDAGPEFAAAAAEAEAFEAKLERALAVPVPVGLVDDLDGLTRAATRRRPGRWVAMALAAGLLLAVGAAGLNRMLNPSWDSVEDYVIDHYYHDGADLVAHASVAPDPARIRAMFARFDVDAAAELEDVVGVIKVCVTPDGDGIHMVLDTASGPVTVIYMPATQVRDRERFAFGGLRAVLVPMERGSAAIIGAQPLDPGDWYAFVQDAIRPVARNS
jgi:hypothetical protein